MQSPRSSSRTRARRTSAGRTSSIAVHRVNRRLRARRGRDLNVRLRVNTWSTGAAISRTLRFSRTTSRSGRRSAEARACMTRSSSACNRRMSHGSTSARRTRCRVDERHRQRVRRDGSRTSCRTSAIRSGRCRTRRRPAATRGTASALSAIVEAPAGINIAPIFLYRSALPTHTFEGLDLNADGNNNDKTASAYQYTGLNANGTATFKEVGDVRHGELQPARAVLSVEPPRQPRVPRRRLCAHRGDRARCSTCSTRRTRSSR